MTVPMLEPRTNASTVVNVAAKPLAGGYASNRSGPIHSVPRDQLYFWSHAWQQLEQQATDDLARGHFSDFDDPREALSWLLSDED